VPASAALVLVEQRLSWRAVGALKKCMHGLTALARFSPLQLLRLVKEKKVEAKHAIIELLNYTPSLSLAAFAAATTAITDLLFAHFIGVGDALSTHFPTHPYVTLLNQRPDAWQHLLHAFVDRLFKDPAVVLATFRPWIAQVLLNPHLVALPSTTAPVAAGPLLLRSQLHAQLVRVGMTTEDGAVGLAVFALLVSFLPFYRYTRALSPDAQG
jgi:hypothetical protein